MTTMVTITTDEKALLQSILDDPAADAPRLVYADWLEEYGGDVPCGRCEREVVGHLYRLNCPDCHGTGRVSDGRRERAEFIRVQVELARLMPTGKCSKCKSYGGPCDTCEFGPIDALSRRERELSRGITDVWPWPFGKAGDPGIGTTWRRGFVESVTCTLADWCGGPCGHCHGTGELRRAANAVTIGGMYRCHVCEGRRTTPGLGPQIVACQPVTGVTLTDKRPTPYREETYWRWFIAGTVGPIVEGPDELPEPLFRAAHADVDWEFPTEDAALAAMSEGLIRWAKRGAEKQKAKENRQ